MIPARIAILSFLFLAVNSVPTVQSAFASERLETLGTAAERHTIHSIRRNKHSNVLSKRSMLFAERLGLLPDLERLESMQATPANDSQSLLSLLLLKQEITGELLIAAQELNTVSTRISTEIADANEIHAHLSEKRDRAVRINTYANFISGGITGMVGGGLKLGDLSHWSPDVIDTTEGAIQTALAAWAYTQQRGEKRMQQGAPNMLTHLMDRSPQAENDYPNSVWIYLNLPDRQGTILSNIVDRWFKLNLCIKHRGHRDSQEKRLKRLGNSGGSGARVELVSIDILEDRMAMLSDLLSSIRQMDFQILELLQLVNGKKKLPAPSSP